MGSESFGAVSTANASAQDTLLVQWSQGHVLLCQQPVPLAATGGRAIPVQGVGQCLYRG